MKALILTEAGENIGFGHLTRCIGLYQGFREKKITVEIVVNTDTTTDFLLKNIKHRKIDWLKNRDIIFNEIKNVDIVVIDSYLADLNFYKKVSCIVKTPVYIDDYKRLNYPKGIVVNPSIYGDKLKYPKRKDVKYLLGKDYIILRKEFWNVPKKKINKEIKNVLITFGGMNREELAQRIKKYLEQKFNFNVFITNSSKNFTAKQMLKMMLKSDLCISGGGQTTYELARVGVPTIGICFAKNQIMNLKYGERLGYLLFGGWYTDENLMSKIKKLIDGLLERYKNVNCVIDGKGVKRIIKKLEEWEKLG
ncbi:MAG: glycosyltransferase [Candidatus Aenigmatarchaeota archaeon]